MVSTKARTIKAKLVMHRATNPTPVPMPREEKRMKAHTRAGMLRRKVAKPRTALAALGKGETFSLPKRETKNARTAATVVEDMARARVTRMLEKIPGMRLALGRAGGRKSWVINSQKASPLAMRVMALSSQHEIFL